MPRRVSGGGDGAAQGLGSPRRIELELRAKDGIGRVAAEAGIRGSPMRAGTRRRAPPARGPGTPEFRNPRLGARAAAGCHGLRGPGRAAWPGRGGGSGPGVGPGAPHLGPGSGRARSPRRLRFSELRRSRAHFRVSGAILGGLAHFRSCRGGGTSGGRGLGSGTSLGDRPPPQPLEALLPLEGARILE